MRLEDTVRRLDVRLCRLLKASGVSDSVLLSVKPGGSGEI